MSFPSIAHALLGLAAASLFFAPQAAGQSLPMAGSQNYIVEAPAFVGGGGALTSASYSATLSIEGPTVPLDCTSTSYRMLGAPALFGSGPSDLPVLFGVQGGLGTRLGGQPVTLFGRNLNAPGAGATTANLLGQPVLGLTVLSSTTATGTTSPGLNPYGNPLGVGAASLQNNLGSDFRPGAFGYTPALTQDSLAVLDAGFGATLHARVGDVVLVDYGFPIPGLAVPLFNLDGALELLTGLTSVVPITPLFAGDSLNVPLAIPDVPALVGLTIPLQGVAFDDLATLTGSFTNVLDLVIQ
jgi:hypothetical protein